MALLVSDGQPQQPALISELIEWVCFLFYLYFILHFLLILTFILSNLTGIGFGGTGKLAYGRQFDPYGQPFGNGDVIGCFLSHSAKTLTFSKNGKLLSTQTLPETLQGQCVYPAFCIKDCSLTFCFGEDEDTADAAEAQQKLEDAEEEHTQQRFIYAPRTMNMQQYLPIPLSPASSSSLSASSTSSSSSSSSSRSSVCQPVVFVLEPARELAEQTHNCIAQLSSFLPSPGLKCGLAIGGDRAPGFNLDLVWN